MQYNADTFFRVLAQTDDFNGCTGGYHYPFSSIFRFHSCSLSSALDCPCRHQGQDPTIPEVSSCQNRNRHRGVERIVCIISSLVFADRRRVVHLILFLPLDEEESDR